MSDITLVIGNKAYSSWSLRPWLMLKQAAIPFTEELIPLRHPDTGTRILARSPGGRVPVLLHGPVTVWESLAIAEYLAESVPAAHLWPAATPARAVARAVSAEMHAGFAALRTHLPMDLKNRFPARAWPAEVTADIARVTALWRDARARFGAGGPFLFGHFTAADAMFAPVVTRFETYGVALDPECRAYADAVLALPAMTQWSEAARAEPWVITFEG